MKRIKPANLLVFAITGKKIHDPLKEAKLKCTISNSDCLSWYKYKKIILTANEIYKNIIKQALLAKYHRHSLNICTGVQGFMFQDVCSLSGYSCWSHDLCTRLGKWLICGSLWGRHGSIIYQYSFITQGSIKIGLTSWTKYNLTDDPIRCAVQLGIKWNQISRCLRWSCTCGLIWPKTEKM